MCSFKLKCTKTVFGRVSAPDSAGGAFLQCSPDLIIGKLEPPPISLSIDAFGASTGGLSAHGPRAPKGIKTALH